MKISHIIIVILITLLIASCDLFYSADWKFPAYDGELNWTLVTEKPAFSNRVDHALVSFDDKLWVLGGYDQGASGSDPYKEDVWSSADGESWTLVTDDAPWKGRRGHSVIVFNNSMYLYGGFSVDEETGYRDYENDIWKTDDGIVWTEVTDEAPWAARFKHCVVKATHGGTDYLYLMTGMGMIDSGTAQYAVHYYNDVWRSSDGENWTELVTSENIGQRSGAAAFVDEDTERMYLLGGLQPVIFDDGADGDYDGKPSENWSDLWYSDNGEDWFNTSSHKIVRADNEVLYLDNRFWFLPGRSDSVSNINYTRSEDLYNTYSFDGTDWVLDSVSSGVGARYGYAATVHKGKMWVVGGRTADDGPDNDVWSADL